MSKYIEHSRQTKQFGYTQEKEMKFQIEASMQFSTQTARKVNDSIARVLLRHAISDPNSPDNGWKVVVDSRGKKEIASLPRPARTNMKSEEWRLHNHNAWHNDAVADHLVREIATDAECGVLVACWFINKMLDKQIERSLSDCGFTF